MDRENFLSKSILEQIDYFNEKLRSGLSITKISKDIGISKSITEKFKKNGYVLQNGQLVYVNSNSLRNNKSNNENTSKEIEKEYIETTSSFIKEETSKVEAPKIKGRPKKANNSINRSISIDKDVWKNLRVYGIMNEIDVSEILEQLAIDFLKEHCYNISKK